MTVLLNLSSPLSSLLSVLTHICCLSHFLPVVLFFSLLLSSFTSLFSFSSCCWGPQMNDQRQFISQQHSLLSLSVSEHECYTSPETLETWNLGLDRFKPPSPSSTDRTCSVPHLTACCSWPASVCMRQWSNKTTAARDPGLLFSPYC